MNKSKHIGQYNVTINDGHLDNVSKIWHYQLVVDKFTRDDEWIDSNVFYIKGHKDGKVAEESKCYRLIDAWLSNVTEEDIDEVFKHKRNHVFKINKPTVVSLY